MSERIERLRRGGDLSLRIAVGIAILSLAVGTIALAFGVHNETRINHFERTACKEAESDPTDHKALHECQQLRAFAEEHANERVNCIPFERAGYPCPKPGSPLAEEHRAREFRKATGDSGSRTSNSNPVRTAASGGDAISSPITGSSHAGPHGSGGGSEHGSGGSHHAPAPGKGGSGGAPAPGGSGGEAPPAPSSSTSSQSTTTERTSESTTVEEPETAAGEGGGGLTEGVGKAVEGLGEAVGGTVGQVEATSCELAEVLC